MPIISGGSSSGAGAITQITDSTLGADGTFTFSGIIATYTSLLLVGLVRLTNASAFDDLVVRFNNDSAANYGSQYVRGNQATASAAEVVTSASPTIARLPAASATANFAGVFELLIPNYAGTTFSKQAVCKTFGASALTTGVMIAETTGVAWSSTAAITRVDLFGATTANAKAGSRVTLYGIS